MHVLVTGGSGFIGGYLIDELLAHGHQIRVISRHPEAWPEDHGRVDVRYGDITRPGTLHDAMQGVDLVFHNAALSADHGPAERFHRVNVAGTQNVLDACRSAGVSRLVFTSSAGVYGFPDREEPITEGSPMRPMNAYQRSKLEAERLVLGQDDVETIAVRPPLVLGAGSPSAALLLSRLAGQEMPLFGSGENLVSLVHPGDVACCLRLAAGRGADGGAYNVVSFACPVRRLFGELAARLGVPAPRRHVPYALAYVAAVFGEWLARLRRVEPSLTRFRVMQFGTSRDICCDRAQRELGFVPAWDLPDLAGDVVAWYRTVGRKY
ncbi:MAG: NAD-dependent epimerase/dehydratase family protein [Thermoplasmatota archaeon]